MLLGSVADTVNITLSLSLHRKGHLLEILAGIPDKKKQLSFTKCHKAVRELHSMALPLPGARGLNSSMQEYLYHIKGERFTLTCSIQEALDYFHWHPPKMAI